MIKMFFKNVFKNMQTMFTKIQGRLTVPHFENLCSRGHLCWQTVLLHCQFPVLSA